MISLLIICALVVFTGLIIVAAMHPEVPQYSLSELKRRAKLSNHFELELRRYTYRADIITLLHSIRAVLLILEVVLLIGIFGWVIGVLLAIFIAVMYPVISQISLVQNGSRKLYLIVEQHVLSFITRIEQPLRFIRVPGAVAYKTPMKLHSTDELTELIASSPDIFGRNERLLLTATLAFANKHVSEVMTPRNVINYIKRDEFLGPLVLDELYKAGHSRLPVIADDMNHVVGVLHTRSLLSLDVKKSISAEKMMEKVVYYIHQDDTLEHALSAFLRTRHHLFIVINTERETVGLLTLEDVIEALIGRRIVDEDDIHADLRAVAKRMGNANNNAPEHVDV